MWENIASNPGYTLQSPEFLMFTLQLPASLEQTCYYICKYFSSHLNEYEDMDTPRYG